MSNSFTCYGGEPWLECPWCGNLIPPDVLEDEGMCNECAKS